MTGRRLEYNAQSPEKYWKAEDFYGVHNSHDQFIKVEHKMHLQ
jgi:hypothetical protein